MSFRNISSWAIRNPLPPIVFFVALLAAGILSFMRMDVNDSPDIDFPAVNVSISQPGAAPSELETQVTQRVESAIRGVNGVEEIHSSVREGNSNTFVSFEIGTPTDRAVSDVRDAVSQIRGLERLHHRACAAHLFEQKLVHRGARFGGKEGGRSETEEQREQREHERSRTPHVRSSGSL